MPRKAILFWIPKEASADYPTTLKPSSASLKHRRLWIWQLAVSTFSQQEPADVETRALLDKHLAGLNNGFRNALANKTTEY